MSPFQQDEEAAAAVVPVRVSTDHELELTTTPVVAQEGNQI